MVKKHKHIYNFDSSTKLLCVWSKHNKNKAYHFYIIFHIKYNIYTIKDKHLPSLQYIHIYIIYTYNIYMGIHFLHASITLHFLPFGFLLI